MKYYIIISLLILYITTGCATREIVKTEYIATPSFCKVTIPTRPAITTQSSFANIIDYNTFLSNLKSILIYADELEMALYCCTNSNDCITK